MTYSELKKLLVRHGAHLMKHGARHDMWKCGEYVTAVARHNREDVKTKTLKTILSDLHINVKQ